jgi:hypothetical protein
MYSFQCAFSGFEQQLKVQFTIAGSAVLARATQLISQKDIIANVISDLRTLADESECGCGVVDTSPTIKDVKDRKNVKDKY